MSIQDFCSLTPEEFNAVCKAHADSTEANTRDRWERMRLHATIAIQPHVKGKLTPQKLIPLPWDKKATVKAKAAPIDKKEEKRRFECRITNVEF